MASSLGPLLLPRLGQEALALVAFLTPEELAVLCRLSRAVSRSIVGDSGQALWHAYFMLNWGPEHGVSRRTEVHVMRSWVDDAWPAPWPLAVGFCGARSALDHLFWFVPFMRCALHVEKSHAVPAPPQALAWQVACHVRSRPYGIARLVRCVVCDTLEVAPPGPAPQHFRRRWARPCDCAPLFSHRACLEQRLLVDSRARDPKASPGCSACGQEYSTSRRFPETLAELLGATMQEWRWVLRRIFVMLVFYVWVYTLASHYSGYRVSTEMCALLLLTACMMSITLSQRFHCGVQKIWNTPHRWFYVKLFGLFALQNYIVSLRALEPTLWIGAAEQHPVLSALHRVHSAIHGSIFGALVLSATSVLYVATASGVIFLFWKTSLRVATVADVDVLQDTGSKSSADGAHNRLIECGLCQLGLCLDNTCM
mmetsp:Transcript_30869/g.67560  ORF Transcript_30869/g.67560 Transcript_30869/m.67560 type:complete len:425 (-) Transcript_30869:118-1392(-)